MNTQRLLIQYPDWHKQPFRLSVEEMENPYLVFEAFFSCYSLMNIRAYLWEWLRQAMHTDHSRTMDLLCFYEHVEKIIETAWVLHSEQQKGNIGHTYTKG